jgi:hypothetical protein
MIPLLPGDCEGGKRIRPEKPVIKGAIFPLNYSWADEDRWRLDDE